MSEIFTIVVRNASVSSTEDILAAYAASTKKLYFLGAEIAANGQTTVGNYPISVKRISSSVTIGSGGASVTPVNLNPDGAAASFTARAGDTTQATGTISFLVASQFNPINGYYNQPPVQQTDMPKCDLSGALVLSLDASPIGTLSVSATLWVREE